MLHPPPTAPSSSSAYNFSSSSTSLYAIDGIGGTPQQQQPPSQHSHNHITGGVQHNHAPYQHNIGGGLLAPHDGGGVGNKRLRSGGAAGASPYGSPPSSPAAGGLGGVGHMGGLHSHQHHAETTRESMAKLTKQTADHLTSLVAVPDPLSAPLAFALSLSLFAFRLTTGFTGGGQLMESTDPEGLAASQLVLALDIVLRFNNKIGPVAGGGAHGVKTGGGGGMVGATHSAHGLMPHSGASRPLTGLASSAPQSYGMPQPQALSQQVSPSFCRSSVLLIL